jgi:hypothetical protein
MCRKYSARMDLSRIRQASLVYNSLPPGFRLSVRVSASHRAYQFDLAIHKCDAVCFKPLLFLLVYCLRQMQL